MGSITRPLTAQEYNLMQDFPPPADRLVNLENWQDPPFNRWAFQHVSNLMPTAQISRGGTSVAQFERAHADLSRIRVKSNDQEITVAQVLESTYTDGLIVLKDGAIVTEKYYNHMTPHTKHLLMSVSKSLTGTLVGILVEAGKVDPDAPIIEYVPELKSSGYGAATVRNALDMKASVVYREIYDDPDSHVQQHERAAGWRPPRDGELVGNYQFLTTLEQDGEHGERFQYCSASTDVLGWVLERASGTSFAELFSREIWTKLGAEHDAYVTVDGFGSPFFNGGINATLRDLARFGQMMLQDGLFNGQHVCPSAWIDDTRNNGDTSAWSHNPIWPQFYPQGNYRNQWYNTKDDHRAYFAVGVHGQHIWIDPIAGVVIVKVSTQPMAAYTTMVRDTLSACAAIGRALVS